MYSAAVSSQLRGVPPATGNLTPIKFEAPREGIADSIDRSESSMQEEGYGSLCEDDHFICIAFASYMVASIEALKQGKFTAARVEFMGFEFLREVSGLFSFTLFRSTALERLCKVVTADLNLSVWTVPACRSPFQGC
ncbi:hypothetical protein LWI29_003777 [Acer saccharum]|uniref:Uncharacterized protein n=1 Tax=Acer saccharum TaxID=4024 RepID=A0AA39T104_ACESA|nr:hypothetical protein LWI29_003777 [Acer saccharum]